MPDKRLAVGLIGAGRIGQVHATNLAFRIPEAALAAVADPDRQAAEALAERCRIPRVAASGEEIFSDPAIRAVVICSPTDTHAEFIVKAARAGKHIFCEKPIDHDLSRIDEALEAVGEAGVQLQVGFNRRFDAGFERVRRAVATGEIGRPEIIHIVSRDPAPPPLAYLRRSGGLFLDMTIHDFDMARFLVGDEVEEIYAEGGVLVDAAIGEAGDLDTAIVLLRFRGGALGTIDNSRQAVYGYDQRVEVFGSRGAIRTENRYPNEAFISDAASVRRDRPLPFFMERYENSFRAELAAFVESILEDKPAPVTGRDGRIPVVMALAARKSYDERRPVRLREIDPACA